MAWSGLVAVVLMASTCSCGSDETGGAAPSTAAASQNSDVQAARPAVQTFIDALRSRDAATALSFLPAGCQLDEKLESYWLDYAIPVGVTRRGGESVPVDALRLELTEAPGGLVIATWSLERYGDTSPKAPTTGFAESASVRLVFAKSSNGDWKLADCPPRPPNL